MVSRYDFLAPSVQVDPYDLEQWPDPLSINWNQFQITTAPKYYRLTEDDSDRIWAVMAYFYGSCEYDDIILILNNVSYRMFLNPGDILFIPEKEDVNRFLSLSAEVGII